jgi:hypothetical protein
VKLDTVEQILIEWARWPGQPTLDIPTNQVLKLNQKDGVPLTSLKLYQPEIIVIDPLFQPVDGRVDFVHKENDFVDFDRDHLIYHMLSTEGPRMFQR